MVDGGWSVLDCAREEVQGVDDMAPLGHYGLGEVVVEEIDGVGVAKCVGYPFHYVEATVMIEDGANFEALVTVEVPRLAAAWLVVDDDGAA